jgi:hypothetical protein
LVVDVDTSLALDDVDASEPVQPTKNTAKQTTVTTVRTTARRYRRFDQFPRRITRGIQARNLLYCPPDNRQICRGRRRWSAAP